MFCFVLQILQEIAWWWNLCASHCCHKKTRLKFYDTFVFVFYVWCLWKYLLRKSSSLLPIAKHLWHRSCKKKCNEHKTVFRIPNLVAVYEAGKPLSAKAAKHCLGWAHPSSAHDAAEDGRRRLSLAFIPRQPPPFWHSHSCPWALPCPACCPPGICGLLSRHWPPYLIQCPQMAF